MAPLRRAGTSDAVLQLAEGSCLMGIYGADYGSSVCRAYVQHGLDRWAYCGIGIYLGLFQASLDLGVGEAFGG